MMKWKSIGEFGEAVVKKMQTWQAGSLTLVPMESLEVCRKLDRAYYVWLACAVRLLKPRNILELGSLRGFSAIAMYSEKQPDAMLTMVDIDISHLDLPAAMKADKTVQVVQGDDLILAAFDVDVPHDVDFLFMDTLHTYEHVSAEWELYRQFLVPGALVVVDDIIMHDVPRWWNNLPYMKAAEFREGHSTGLGYFFFREISND